MQYVIESSTSTDPSDAFTCGAQGAYKLLASIVALDGAVIAMEERIGSSAAWVPMADLSGNQVILSESAPSCVFYALAGQQVRGTRSTGTEAVSVAINYVGDSKTRG